MSLLNNLQSQVEKITEEESRKNAEFLEQEVFYDNHLKHVMVRVHNYFEEIIKNLNIVAPEIYPSYPLNPIERNGVTLKQADYDYSYDNGRHPRQIDILTICNLKRPVEFKEKRLKEEDLAEAYAQIQAERLEVENAKLINRTRRAIVKGNQEILKIVLRGKITLNSLYRG